MMFRFRFPMLAAFTIVCLALSGCSKFPPRFYRMDVQQGSDVTSEMVRKLKKGMTKEQVQETLGTPTLTHFFDADRWDYYYSLVPGSGAKKIEKHFSVFFKNNRVTHWEGDVSSNS